ncbi:hypothetical protein [Nocardioides zeicaulis]|uniref:Lipoprotein n=1 Tax=Nocardioides zeicaulis TaxID=1776857 RepID=A0ABV6DZP7_9ACTN
MTTTLRRSGARTRTLAGLLGGLALAASLTACGGDDGGDDVASDPSASSTPSSTPSTDPAQTPSSTTTPEPDTGSSSRGPIEVTGSAGVKDATLMTATDAGGEASSMAFAVDTDQARADFASQLEGTLGDEVSQEAAQQQAAAPGTTPYAAIVGVGCEPPTSVAVDAGEAGFQVTAELPKSNMQCFAAMTFVVVFSVPDA